MATLREIKKRIVNVSNVQRITQSLKAVATSRLASIKNINSNNLFFSSNKIAFNKLFWLHKNYAISNNPLNNMVLNNNVDNNKNSLIIFFSSNRGLCGAYNNNILKSLHTHITNLDKSNNFLLLAIGERGYNYANKNYNNNLLKLRYSSELKDISYDDFAIAAITIINLIKQNKINNITILYTFSHSVISQEVKIEQLLPLKANIVNEKLLEEENLITDEVNITQHLEQLLQQYIAYKLYDYFINSLIAEFSSRLTAMDNAYENCKDLKEKLSLIYNRTRQGMVTKELSEIVAGAEAS